MLKLKLDDDDDDDDDDDYDDGDVCFLVRLKGSPFVLPPVRLDIESFRMEICTLQNPDGWAYVAGSIRCN